MNRDIHNMIAREYERRQKLSADSVEQKKSALYAKIPQLQKIDDEINQMGLRYNRLILMAKGDSDIILSELSQNLNHLANEKKQLLMNHHISPDYFAPQYQCSRCKDTGYIIDAAGSERCSCYKQQVISCLFLQSNVNLNGPESFDNFNYELYPEEVNEKKYGISVSPRENILEIKKICVDFIKNIDSPQQKNLFFSGRTGVGKTFLSLCIARELLNHGRIVLYLTAPVLFDIVAEYKMKAYKEENYNDDKYQSIFTVDLLIIDDLGTEPLSDSRYAELLNILNSRQSRDAKATCKTIISTNVGPKKLFELYTERIMSRIVGHFDRLVLAGEDIRNMSR